MGMAPIVDAIRDAVPVPSGVTRQDGLREPAIYRSGRLYAWPGVEVRVEEGDGSLDRGDFTLSLAVTIVVPREGDSGPDRDSSLTLDDAADDIAEWVRDNRVSGDEDPRLWEDLQVSRIDYAALHGQDWAGVRLDLSGYRQITS